MNRHGGRVRESWERRHEPAGDHSAPPDGLRAPPDGRRGRSDARGSQAGAPEATGTAEFLELVRRHDKELRMLAYRLLGDRIAMDDAMQDAYLKAFRGFSGFRGEAQASTWLYRIVYNACLDRLRSERRRREVPLDRVDPGADLLPGSQLDLHPVPQPGRRSNRQSGELVTVDQADSVVQRVDLAAALAALPHDERAVVLLIDAAGLTYEEAAEVLGVRPGTIGSRLHHARSVLGATLGTPGEGTRGATSRAKGGEHGPF
jgi:RNA polymerase sigma-70 factor (ECF subfamily)